MQVAADTLKEFTVLQQHNDHQPSRRGGNKEAHPRAVLSTTKRNDDPTPSRGSESASSTTPSSSPQVIKSSKCSVSRQMSSPVDLPPASSRPPTCTASLEQDLDGYLVIGEPMAPMRPENLPLRREVSSSSAVSTPRQEPSVCSCLLPSPGLVSSYPPGRAVTRVQACSCSARQPYSVSALLKVSIAWKQ